MATSLLHPTHVFREVATIFAISDEVLKRKKGKYCICISVVRDSDVPAKCLPRWKSGKYSPGTPNVRLPLPDPNMANTPLPEICRVTDHYYLSSCSQSLHSSVCPVQPPTGVYVGSDVGKRLKSYNEPLTDGMSYYMYSVTEVPSETST
ncbi:hypothetical protein GE21DRAFT_3585 [Neurospora crassa]|uniref:Uncharacterized protein n=2 Tax=Neurospora crassa TaxID=5141 RepID=F5HE60_NEUCR|nr:hypothetical protein NCU08711 [Neurospora crassa OR74A]EAA34336.2 hypothetical protein NCU08711 [Neurospora crassa OR74A]KHE82913.1 hypothetical protein GE21DRAFT_3585 [Neurospora crassa]CAB99382.2 hypothetical protein [Neurospora crassa]|eukprot:XP_963572.2 hypothetical protein NCU08711 [Neurospora crassa OR74A]